MHILFTPALPVSSSVAFCVALWSFQTPRCVLSTSFTFMNASAAEIPGHPARAAKQCRASPCFQRLCGRRGRRGRPRGKRRASPGVGGAMGPSSVLARRPPPPEHHCPSTSRAAAKFSVYVVESWQKSRPPGRRRVESGAAEQGCYKEAFAHGLEEERKRHDGAFCADAMPRWPILPPRLALKKRWGAER